MVGGMRVNLAETFLDKLGIEKLPGLGPEARSGRLSLEEVEALVQAFCGEHRIGGEKADCLRSAGLLWHDYLDESHSISQGIETADGSFLHGIMHRREPDYWNAGYWFKRVGHHPAYERIGELVMDLYEDEGWEDWAGGLACDGEWDPFVMLKLCEEALEEGDEEREVALRRIQHLEFQGWLEGLLG
jgi:hypothetical protein